MQTIETHEVHPDDLNTFPCYEEVSKDIEERIVEYFSNGETEINLSVNSGKGSRSQTVYKCIPKRCPVKSIKDCDFFLIKL